MELHKICELIVDCEHKTALTQEAGYPSIRTPNIGKGRLILNDVNRVSEEVYREWTRRAIPQDDDLILAREAPAGNIAIIKKGVKVCLGQRTVLIRPNKKIINPDYLLYLLLDSKMQHELLSRGSGVTVPHINMEDIRALSLPDLPDIFTQAKIAAILSVNDDLIENNNQRINILEEMVQTTYDEWFVKFRFPGHSKVKMIDSLFGKIPEGWEIKQVKEFAEICRGKSYRSVDLAEKSGKPFLNLKNIQRYGGYRGDGLKWYVGEYKDSQVAKPTDIVIAVTDMTQERMIVARAARVPKAEYKEYVFSMDLVKVQPKDEEDKGFLSGAFLYSSFGDEVKQYANGVNVLHLSPDRIAEFRFIIPPRDLRQKYSNILDDAFSLADTLRAKNKNLSQARNLLHHKLISGEIDVKDMDIDIGETDDR